MDKRFQRLISEVLFTEGPGPFSTEYLWQPPTDVFECEDNYVVVMEIAGVSREDFQIGISDDVLTISGCRRESSRHSKVALRRFEISYGTFKRSVFLPGPVESENIEARYENGFLEVILPKVSPRRLSINVDGED